MPLLKPLGILLVGVILFAVLIIAVDQLYEKMQDGTPKINNKSVSLVDFPEPYLTEGFDWSLPPNTPIEPYSGLIDENNSGLKVINNSFKILRWDHINPKRNVYDFSEFDNWLSSNNLKKVLVRLEVNSACETPKWALQELRVSNHKSLIFWDKAYLDILTPLIKTFAKRYADNSQIIGVQLGIGDGEYAGDCHDYDNKDGWGEFWMSPEELAEAQTNFGLTPQIFEQRTLEIIDIYQSAFKQYSRKLAFTNIGSLFSYGVNDADKYNQSLLRISKYALEKGLGSRDGEVEIWLRYLDKIYGNKFVSSQEGTCKLEFDESYIERIAGRYWGSENEFYGKSKYILDIFGPYENQPYRFLVSSLRTLQMRRNFFSLSGADFIEMDDPVYKIQDFLNYLTKVMGKQKHNTPDAFILLGERYITKDRAKDHIEEACVKNKEKVAIRSFGRWLTESSSSKPSIKINMPKSEKYWGQDFYLPDGIDYEYAARSSNKFEFDLNDQLITQRCKNGCDAEIKIVFKDVNKTSIFVRIAEGISARIQTLGDHKIKTATFRVKSRFINALKSNNKGKDFIIESTSSQLSLMMVRMNFL